MVYSIYLWILSPLITLMVVLFAQMLHLFLIFYLQMTPLFFCGATKDEALAVRSILNIYKAFGQQVNLAKSSVLFGKGVAQHRKDEVLLTLDIREILSYDKYLGFPTKIGKPKKAFCPSRTASTRELIGG